MQVMHDRVLIKKIEPETKSAGRLFLTHVQDQTFEATVVGVGKGKPIEGGVIAPTVKEGDTVIYNPNATVTIKIGNQEYLVIKEEEIFAIVDSK